ncbi:MAG: hypothetical protein LBR30_07055, partial [Clostridioides sp.]|nr:hypothetical protein [Clostridioides sp.]
MRNNVRILTIITSFILVISSIFQVKSFGETLNLDVYARQDFLDRSSYRERLNTSYIDSLKAKQYAEVTTWNEFATAYNDASNKAIIIKNDINRSDEAKPTTLNARKDNIIIIGENFDSSQGYYKLNLGNINLPIASLSSNNKQTFAIQNLSLYRKCIKDRFDYSQAFIAPGAITEPLATSEDYTQYWYFEFGNISSDDVDGAKDAGKGEYNGASVPRLLLGKRAQVTFYGDCEVNSAYENATVGSIIFDYGCVYKGKVCGFKNGILRNAGNLPIFSYRSTTDDASRTGNSKEFTVKEGADVHLENDNERTKYPMIYQNRDDLAYNTVLSKIVVEKYGKLYAKVNGPVLRLHQNDKFIVNENTEVHLISTADTSFTLDNNIKLEYTAIRLNADATTEVKVTSPKLFEICNLKNKTFLVWRHGNETLDFFNTNLVSWNNGSSLNGAPDRDWGYISKYRCGDNSDTTHLLTNKTTQGAIWRDESDNSTWFQPNNYQRIVCYTPTAENIELKLLPYKNVIGDPNRISDADLHADAEIYVTLHLDAGDVKFKPFERENYEVQLFSKDKEATKRSTLGFPRAIGFDPSDPGSDIDEGGQNDEYVPIDATLFATGNNISKNPRALNGKVEGTSDTVAIEWDDFLKPDQTIYYKVIRIRAELESDVNGSKPKLPITVASITPVDEENGETLSIKEGLFLEA